MPSSGLMSTSMIEQGWAALNAGDVATACDAFEEALAEAESGAAREGLGQALYLRRDYAGAIAQQERAYAAYRRDVIRSRPRGPRAIWRGSLGMCSAIGRFTTAGWHGRAGSSKKLVTMVRSTPGC